MRIHDPTRELSRNNADFRIFMPAIVTVLVVAMCYAALTNIPSLRPFVILLAVVFGGQWIRRRHSRAFDFTYNSEFLFLKSRKVEREISLLKIKGLEPTGGKFTVLGMRYKPYTIEFENEQNDLEIQKLYILDFDSHVSDFQDVIKAQRLKSKTEN